MGTVSREIEIEQTTEDFVRALDRYLSHNRLELKGANAYDLALGITNQQQQRWGLIFQSFESAPSGEAFAKQLALLKQILFIAIPSASVNRTSDKVVIVSQMPVLAEDPPRIVLDKGAEHPILAALIVAKRCRDVLQKSDHHLVVGWLASSGAVELSQLATPNRTENEEELHERLDAIDESIASGERKFHELRVFSGNELDSHKSMLALKEKEIDDLIRRQTENEVKWTVERRDSLDAFRKEMREFAKIETSINLWRTKARWHTFNYIFLGVLFGGSLVAIAGMLIFGYVEHFVTTLTKIPADHQFLGIALLAIPTLAVAWLLRFIARLAIQNLSLAHDARQRHAQVNTYLRLLGDPQKPITENERVLALAALFRPLPGLGPDDVNPPTIADLLKEAQQKTIKPAG